MFVNVTTAGKLIFPRRGEKKKKEKKRIKGENLCFFFPVFPGMTRGFGNAVEDNLPTKFQRHGASEALLTGASPRFFSLPPLGWGRDDLFRVTRRRKRTGRERVHRPKRRGARSGGKEGAVVVCSLQGTRKIWSKMLGEDSSRVARHVVVGTLLGKGGLSMLYERDD